MEEEFIVRKILVAYDGSELSQKAVSEAERQMARNKETELHLLSIAEITGPSTSAMMQENITNEQVEKMNHQLTQVKNSITAENTDVITKVVIAKGKENAGKSICKYAEHNEIDMIVVGSRGLGNVKGLFLGSVSNNIVQNSVSPVTVVK